jgi:hypothetical protein
MSKKNNVLLLLIVGFITFYQASAQTSSTPKDSRLFGNSPYSAIGIGEVLPSSNIANEAMGGTSLTFANGIYVNTANPAMLTKNRYLAFNAGLTGNIKKISSETTSQQDFGMNLSHLAFAFPVKSRWSMSVGIRPNTVLDHEARYLKTIVGTTNTVEYTYRGFGGISKATWSNGFLIGKSFHVGTEIGYNFGSFTRDTTSRLLLGDGSDYYLRYSDRTSPKGFSYKAGFVWQNKISSKWNLNIGGTYEGKTNLKADKLRSFTTLTDAGSGPVLLAEPDTLQTQSGKFVIPAKYSVGISLESPFKWVFAAEYSIQDWSLFKNFDGKSLSNYTKSETIALGIESIPKATSTKYLNQVFYRIGYKQSKTPYLVNQIQVIDRSFTFGFSIPLAYRSPSYIDLGFAAGSRGKIGSGLVKDTYYRVSIGFSFMDTRWFAKPKID